MKRKRLPPDTRHRWDDPDLPCSTRFGWVAPKRMEENAQRNMALRNIFPHWTNDRTYNLRRCNVNSNKR